MQTVTVLDVSSRMQRDEMLVLFARTTINIDFPEYNIMRMHVHFAPERAEM